MRSIHVYADTVWKAQSVYRTYTFEKQEQWAHAKAHGDTYRTDGLIYTKDDVVVIHCSTSKEQCARIYRATIIRPIHDRPTVIEIND